MTRLQEIADQWKFEAQLNGEVETDMGNPNSTLADDIVVASQGNGSTTPTPSIDQDNIMIIPVSIRTYLAMLFI